MPHDKNGTKIEKGDRVMVPCVVSEVYETEDGLYCNVNLNTEIPMPPYTDPNRITLNTKQVIKCEVTITKIQVDSDDPDQFVFDLVKKLNEDKDE